MNPVLETIASHQTIRSFTDEPVPDAVVERVVRAAQHASTSSNVQGYALLRVRDAEKRERLVELTGGQPQVARAAAFFVVCADQRRHRLAAERLGRPYEPNLETWLVAVVDASLFAQNVALGFESEGWGICFIGGLRNRLPEADALLGLPQDVLPLYGLCVGRPAEEPSARPRLPLEAVLVDETYPTDEVLWEEIERYDEAMGAYYAARGKAGWSWSDGTSRKFAAPRREHLRAFYEGKGASFG